jgi:hypothetical protein
MHFRHVAAKDVHAPGYYLHLAPDSIFAGADARRLQRADRRVADHRSRRAA